jgi:glycosyltransferase involved in cell wall biosynthesis
VGPYGHGGEEVYVRTILENAPRGVEYVPAGSFHEGAPGAPCRRVEEVLLNRLVHPAVIPDMGFRALALRERFDLVHVHAHPVRLARLNATPLVMSEGSSSAVYLQDYLGWSDARLERAYGRARRVYRALGIHDRLLNLARVSRAYVFSRWARDLNVRWGADPQKMDVVYPGFPTPAPVDRGGRTHFTFLFVGTDFERKGGFEVVEAFADLTDRRPEVRLMLVCPEPSAANPDRALHSWVTPGRRQRLLARLEELERAGKARRRPLLPRSVLFAEAYPAADAFVMPSHAEGFGFTNVEALSFGLPVVSSRIGAIPETVADGRTGLLVPAGDVSALAAAMDRLLADPALARWLGENARAEFLSRFTLERFRTELARVYREAQD